MNAFLHPYDAKMHAPKRLKISNMFWSIKITVQKCTVLFYVNIQISADFRNKSKIVRILAVQTEKKQQEC